MWWSKTSSYTKTKTEYRKTKIMLKTKLMKIFKGLFGGTYIKKDGKVYWLKDKVNTLVTSAFLLLHINSKKSPAVESTLELDDLVLLEEVEAPVVKKVSKRRAKKNDKPSENS